MFWRNYECLCRSVGKSPNAVASECDVRSSATVSGWKLKGAVPRGAVLEKIANYFGVTPFDLLNVDLTEANVTKDILAKKFTLSHFSRDERASDELSVTFDDLSADEIALVNAYVAGLRASRKP